MKHMTTATKASDITRSWHLVDAGGKILGTTASAIAQLLIGKNKPYFTPHLDCGDYVVVIHAANVAVTGKKEKNKMYSAYSGYPGGLKKKPLWKIRQDKPTELIRHAVWGMLPKNKLRHRMITRLYVYPDNKHPYGDKFTSL